MSSSYAGDPNAFPVDYVIPDDSDPPTATVVAIGLEALGDRTAHLKLSRDALVQGLAADFYPPISGVGGLDLVKQRAGVSGRRVFYASSSSSVDLLSSTNDYRAWPAGTTGTSSIPVAQRDVDTIGDFEVDGSGNIVALDHNSNSARTFNAGTSTWARIVPFGVLPLKPSISYDAASTLWCGSMIASGAPGPAPVYTSSDRATWTFRGNFSSAVAGVSIASAAGVTVLQIFRGAEVVFARSLDGGVSWSSLQTFALPFSPAPNGFYWPRPVWTGAAWVACVSDGAALSGQGRVYRSTDGASWSLVATFTNSPIRYLAFVAPAVLCALVGDSEAAVSIDEGASWHRVDTNFSPTPTTVAGCDGRLVVIGAGSVHVSRGYGPGALAGLA